MNVKNLSDLTYFRGRVALHAILKALNIGQGDQVATQAFTCIAVPESIMAVGARPVYIDIEPTGFNMDVGDLERKITLDTRAIIVQHTFGIPAEMDEIIEVAEKFGLPIIEDCCHTLNSTYHGKSVGSFGVASFYSFEWGKPIVVGIGGSAIINDEALRDKVYEQYDVAYRFPVTTNQIRLQLQYFAHHLLYRPILYWPVRSLYHLLGSIGVAESNYNPIQNGNVAEDFSLRMSAPLQERLTQKLQNVDKVTRHSQWVAREYQSRIKSPVVTHPELPEDSHTVFARYPLITQNKKDLLVAARKANVELAEWYSTPVHPLAQNDWTLIHYQAGSCPNVEKRCNQVVTLPTHLTVVQRDIDRAVNFFNTVSI